MTTALTVRHYSPKEFSTALAEFGIHRSERWIADRCGAAPKLIRTVRAFRPRHVIPETEVLRIVGLLKAS